MFRSISYLAFFATMLTAPSQLFGQTSETKNSEPIVQLHQQEADDKAEDRLPNILIIGDSISIGYTPGVKSLLAEKANVVRIKGNSEGTTKGVAKIEAWLGDKDWDVIHFNFGLHDLKRVKKAGTSKNSNNPDDPYQADLETYTNNMRQIVEVLKQSEAKLIFATTTPFPAGVKPFRDPADVARYNDAAIAIMSENEIQVNDLCAAIAERLDELQQPTNVHFTKDGSQFLAQKVANTILETLPSDETDDE